MSKFNEIVFYKFLIFNFIIKYHNDTKNKQKLIKLNRIIKI